MYRKFNNCLGVYFKIWFWFLEKKCFATDQWIATHPLEVSALECFFCKNMQNRISKVFFVSWSLNSLARRSNFRCVQHLRCVGIVLKFGIRSSESRSGRRKYCARSLREVSSKSKAFSARPRHTRHSSRYCFSVHILGFSIRIQRERIGLYESSLFTYNLSRASCRYHICPLWENILHRY